MVRGGVGGEVLGGLRRSASGCGTGARGASAIPRPLSLYFDVHCFATTTLCSFIWPLTLLATPKSFQGLTHDPQNSSITAVPPAPSEPTSGDTIPAVAACNFGPETRARKCGIQPRKLAALQSYSLLNGRWEAHEDSRLISSVSRYCAFWHVYFFVLSLNIMGRNIKRLIVDNGSSPLPWGHVLSFCSIVSPPVLLLLANSIPPARSRELRPMAKS
ncbi:hypothetical protein HDK77DRAFT_296558 [Phyllosticta capitalensis]